MIGFTDRWAIPWLLFLADWSIRWGIVLAILAVWFALAAPRRARVRYILCSAAVVAGLAIPLAPRWGNLPMAWPLLRARDADGPIEPWNLRAVPVASAPVRDSRARRFELPKVPTPVVIGANVARSASGTLGWLRILSLLVAAVWALGALVALVRLAGGWLTLNSLSRRAVDLNWRSSELVCECRRAVGLTRRFRLGSHPEVASPVAIGGLVPLILVPSNWADWSETNRRACLLHELTHLARRDDWAKLALDLILAIFFFHPLLRWLRTRFDRERELLCDEAVVSLGMAPAEYARLLLDLAMRPGRLFSSWAEAKPMFLPFFDRRTVAIRISRLLEEDMLHTLSRGSFFRSLFAGSLAVTVALAVTGVRLRAVEPQAKQAARGAVETRSEVAAKSPRHIEGLVLDPDGKPVADAVVVAGIDKPGIANHQILRTDTKGRFTWPLSEGPVLAYLVAHRQGFAPGVWTTWMEVGKRSDRVEMKLSKPDSFAAVVVDETGKPVSGAKIAVERVAHSSATKDGPRTMVSTGFQNVNRNVIDGSPLEALFETTTGADGSFIFQVFAPGSGLLLSVTDAAGRRSRLRPAALSSELVRKQLEETGFMTAPPGEKPTLVLVKAAKIAGRVVSKVPGVTVGGLEIYYQGSAPRDGRYRPILNESGSTRTDGDGRFTLDALNEGTINIIVNSDGQNHDWTYRAAEDVKLVPGVNSEVVIELIRGVAVEGSVVLQGANTPLPGAQLGVYGPFRPRTSAMTLGSTTDASGRYRYRLPSGETYLYVMAPPTGFTRLPGEGSSRTVTIPDGAEHYEVPPIELVPAVTMRGRVVGSTGKPIEGAKVVGICENGLCRPFPGTETLTDSKGDFQLPPGMYNTVATGKPARLLIRLRGGAEHEATATPGADGAVTIELAVRGDETDGGK